MTDVILIYEHELELSFKVLAENTDKADQIVKETVSKLLEDLKALGLVQCDYSKVHMGKMGWAE